MVSGPDAAWANSDQLQLYKVKADGSYEILVDYAAANYYSTEMGNFRVKGDVTKNAVITAYICDGFYNLYTLFTSVVKSVYFLYKL